MLKDLKVIEFAGVLAGPAVGMFLAELGAEVIKIENPQSGGDSTRNWKTKVEDSGSASSAYFASVNWGKKHLFIDLHSNDGIKQIRDLIASADIVISNWKPGDAGKLNLDDASLRKIKPDIIYAELTGFGNDDDRVAYDVVLQAETGWMSMNGDQDSGPLKIPVAIIDLFAAHQLKEGILLALIKKLKTGEGSRVSVSLFDAAVASLANQAANYLMTGEIPRRTGSLHPNIAPYGEILQSSDGKEIVLAIGTDKQFTALCEILNCRFLIPDIRFKTNKNRVENRIELFEILQQFAKEIKADALLQLCNRQKIPVAEIKNLKELFDSDAAGKLILRDELGSRVRTAVFKIS